eukprot:c10049_g1_i2.p1 GENE.c10049_g1_i2~~c10049_g1_i2.p1  ORF type:complete len:223 (+),score=57.69 c10049_g1_i2:44-712(+)
MNLFGSKKKKPLQQQHSPQDAIQRLNEALSNLDKREAHIQKKVDAEVATAKKLIAAKNKNGAKMALKRKKMYETQIEKIFGTRMTIENQKMALESATFNREIIGVMELGGTALRAVNQNLTIDQVDATMDNIQEQMDLANEIADAISQPSGAGALDDDELEAELAELEAEGLDQSLLNVEDTRVGDTAQPADNFTDSLPDAPTHQIHEEDEELRRLEAEMAA